jgi:hypothetical protein
MGLFDNMKKAMDSAKEGYAQAADAAKTGVAQAKEQFDAAKSGFADAAAESRAAQEELERNRPIIDPTPQHEVDRINAGSGSGLAVVSGNRNTLESGENVFRTNAQIAVRMRLADGKLGEATWHKLWTSSGVIRALVPGTEVPAEIDRATELVTGLDQKAIAAALKTRKKSGGGW